MGDDSEWMKLPTDEKVQHKVWKARLAGYEEACKLFGSIGNEKSPEFNKYAGIMKKFVTDTNAVAQEKALDAVIAFVENANVAGRVCQDIIQGVITKCFNASKQRTKEKGIEIVMLYIEMEKQDIVQECLIEGLGNKQPKIVVVTIQTLRMALRDFGNKIMPIKPLVPKLPKLLEDRDKNVREEAKLLIIEMYRWIKQAIKPQMTNFNPIQVAELEAEFEKIGNEKPQQQRFLRSQQDLKAKMEEQALAGGGGDEGEEEAEDEVDAYELLSAVDILALLPKDFYDKIESKKWQERKEALEALEKLTSNPKLEGGDYGQLVRALLKVISKDTNVMLVALGGKCLAGIANGLRKKFTPYGVNTVQCVLEKFKEKKQMVVVALRECIDAAFPSITLDAVQEDIVAALDNKNPSIKAETASFLARCFAKSTMSTLPKKLLKLFCTSLMKTVSDTAPDVREASFQALGTAMKVVSEKHMMPFLVDVDNIKMQKIKECCDSAVLLNMKGEPRSGQAASKPADNQPKPVQRPATAPSAAAKGTSSRPSTAHPSGKSKASSGPPKKAAAKGKGTKKGPAGGDKQEITEAVLSDEAVDEKAEDLFTADVLKQLVSANWKERLEGIQRVTDIVKEKSKEELKTQVVVRTVAKKPGLKDNNFQVLKCKMDLLAHLGKNTVFTKVSAGYVLSDLVDKIADVKNGSAVQEALSCISEACTLEFVGKEVITMAFEQKNPKVQSESLNWLSTAIKEFGLKVNVKLLIENIKKSFAHTNPVVRSAGIGLCGVIYMYMGQNFRIMYDNEKPALLKELDAEIEKVKGEKPPAPVRGLAAGGDADEEDDDADQDDKDDDKIDDSLPRTDISERITPELVDEMADKNWKIRKEALEKVEAILKEAPFVAPSLGPLPEALKLRLNDNNKILIGTTLGICSSLGTKLGPHCKVHIKVMGPAIISCFGDSKPNLRASAVSTLNVWMENCNLIPLVEQETFSDALKLENPNLRQELLGWLSEKLPNHKPLPAEFKLCIPHLLSCLEDRNGEVRKKAQDAIVPFMIHTGYDSVFRACSKLKPASKDQIMAIIEKAKANLPAKPVKAKKAPAKASSAAVVVDDYEEEVKAPSRPLSTASSEGAAESKPETKAKTVRGKAKAAAPATSKKKKTEEDTSPPMNLTVPKEKRFKDEKSLKVLKWNFIQLTGEYVEQLTVQMEKNFSKGMMDMMFNVDFKQHTKAIEILIKSLDTLTDETVGNLDLLLKWFTVRFLDTNPSMLNKALEYLRKVFTMLVDMDYSLHEYEACSFIPYLIIKVGDAKDNVRKDVRGIIKILYKLYPVSKMFTFLMDGIKSKNAKQRMECIEELGNLIESYGLSVCQPSPNVALKNITGQIGDRDNGVRNAALNAAVQAYMVVGENQFYKLTGNLNDKDQSLLDERIKRSLKNKPAPKAKEEERPKTAPTQPQRSASQTQIQRPTTALPKSASSTSMKKTFLPEFEYQKTEMEMPKLYQYDLDELFKPLEMPKINRARDPSPMTRVSPADASATIGVVIAQITSTDVLTCIQALAQIDELLKDEEHARLLGDHVDQLMLHISMQFRMTLSTHMNNEDVPKEDVVRLYRCLLGTLLALTQNPFLATKTSKEILKDLFNSLITLLLDQRLSLLNDGPQVVRSVNVMIVKLMEKSDYTNTMCALIKSLQDCVATETFSPKFSELVMKCIWKMIKMIPEIINDLAVDRILLETHLFLRNFPTSTWKSRPSDLPLIKTVHALCAFLKDGYILPIIHISILGQLNLIDASENSEVKMFLQKSLKKDPNSRNEMNGTSDDTDSGKSHQKPKKLNKSTHDMLAEIFKKIGSKENTIEGLNNLYDFKKKHPEADLDPFLKMSSQYFQNYYRLANEPAFSCILVQLGIGPTVPSAISAPSASSDDGLDVNFYLDKLRTIRAKCGLENTDPSKQENVMSKKEDKPEKAEKIALEEKNETVEISVKPVLSSSENRENNPQAASAPSAPSADVSELKQRLERIKKLAKS
ncbi:cytoskeleton-associated protein 5-A-like [Saccostrea cucullata]|uniref:cytoskeleton-associated protein 5-A-like n=1 Tax=Saccostrea cuccullata TaxID=36930 RepID=UPI002ED2F118